MCLLAHTIVNAFRFLFIRCLFLFFLRSAVSSFVHISHCVAEWQINKADVYMRIYTHLLWHGSSVATKRLIFLLVCAAIQFAFLYFSMRVNCLCCAVYFTFLSHSLVPHTDTLIFCWVSRLDGWGDSETVIIYGPGVGYGAHDIARYTTTIYSHLATQHLCVCVCVFPFATTECEHT